MNIDTIVFKLLNISDYPELIQRITYIAEARLNKTEFEDFTNFRQSFEYEVETGEQLDYRLHFKQKAINIKNKATDKTKYFCSIPSHTSKINYTVDTFNNYIAFNFSIPKYLYGSNIRDFGQKNETSYNDLINFFKKFISLEFSLNVKLRDIEIKRIDFCYNYKFESEDNKIKYISQIRNQFEIVFGKAVDWENETIMYHTKSFSFKIYDKEKEFIKNSYNKIRDEEKANEYLKECKNVLRFEITFRNTYFQNLYNLGFFKYLPKQSYYFDFHKKRYDFLKCVFERVKRHYNNSNEIDIKNIEGARKVFKSISEIQTSLEVLKKKDKIEIEYCYLMIFVNNEYLQSSKIYERLIEKKQFVMDVNSWELTLYQNEYCRRVHYSKGLHIKLESIFKDYILKINDFQYSANKIKFRDIYLKQYRDIIKLYQVPGTYIKTLILFNNDFKSISKKALKRFNYTNKMLSENHNINFTNFEIPEKINF